MASAPIITFKAGRCEVNGRKVTAVPTPGYLYLYSEEDLLHFCWRPRSAPSTQPELDLIMFPQDGHFYPLVKEEGADDLHSPTNGRIFVLKFTSSSQKHYFWMQSKSQAKDGTASWFSLRDQRLGQIVDELLQGEEVDMEAEIRDIREHEEYERDHDGDDDAMEVDERQERRGSGGAGQDATGGDPREEGEASREGGADGGRAPRNRARQEQDASQLVQNLLNSLGGPSGGQMARQSHSAIDKPYTTLPDLLTPASMTSYLSNATPDQVDQLCAQLPSELFLVEHDVSDATDPQAAIQKLSLAQKKAVINRVLHSPQLQQSLSSLTVALRDGGLPMIGEALKLKVENGGHIRGGVMPLGGGAAVEAFVEGVKRTVEEEKKHDNS